MQCKLGLETGFQDLTKHLMSMVLWCCSELHCQKHPQQSVCYQKSCQRKEVCRIE